MAAFFYPPISPVKAKCNQIFAGEMTMNKEINLLDLHVSHSLQKIVGFHLGLQLCSHLPTKQAALHGKCVLSFTDTLVNAQVTRLLFLPFLIKRIWVVVDFLLHNR